jgi:hypothetical protein
MASRPVGLLIGLLLVLAACGPSAGGEDATVASDASADAHVDLMSGDGVPVAIV